ncbi:hypothetical protein D9M68_932950 [compost metagenome]
MGIFLDRCGDELLEVQPGTEGARPGGGEDDAADGAIGGEGVEQVGNLAIERQRQGIGGRAIDLDRRDLAFSFHHQGHAKTPVQLPKGHKTS